MRLHTRIARTLVIVGSLIGSTQAQSVWRFDMGPASQAVASGFTPVASTSAYSPAVGWGWVGSPGASTFREDNLAWEMVHNHPVGLIDDGIRTQPGGELEFQVDLPSPGKYHVRVLVGEPEGRTEANQLSSSQWSPQDGITISCNSSPVVGDGTARLIHDKARLDNPLGGYKSYAFKAYTTLALPFAKLKIGSTVPGQATTILGIQILPMADHEEPVWFDAPVMQPGTLLVRATAGNQFASVGTAVSLINSGNYASAWQDLGVAVDLTGTKDERLARVWARAWWLGWLKDFDSEGRPDPTDQVDLAKLDILEAELADLDTLYPGEALIEGLLAETKDFHKGALFVATRGYMWLPSDPGASFPNPDNRLIEGFESYRSLSFPNGLLENVGVGLQFLEQIQDDWLEESTGVRSRPSESPFFGKAQYLKARAMWGENTSLQRGADPTDKHVAFNVDLQKSFAEIWPLLDPASIQLIFASAHEARMLTWLVHTQSNQDPNDGTLNLAVATQVSPPGDFTGAWWQALIPSGLDLNPNWASNQIGVNHFYRELGDWWLENRLYGDCQLGGGPPDDIELYADLIRIESTRVEEPGNAGQERWAQAMECILNGPNMDVSEGYFDAGSTSSSIPDAEHGSETTTWPLRYMLLMRYGDPYFTEYGLRFTQNLDEPNNTNDVDWTFQLIGGERYFQHHWFDANDIRPDSLQFHVGDIGKVVLPSMILAELTHHPLVNRYMRELGLGWQLAAETTGPLLGDTVNLIKPRGILPGGVNTGNYSIESGPQSSWYWDPAASNGAGAKTINYYASTNYMLLIQAARNATTQAESESLYDTIYAGMVYASGFTADPDASAGSGPWVAAQLKHTFGSIAHAIGDEMAANLPASTSFSQSVIDQYGFSGGEYFAYLQQLESSPGSSRDRRGLSRVLGDGFRFYEFYLPLATTAVLYADKAYGHGGSLTAMQAMPLGGSDPIEGTLVSWFDASTNGVTELEDLALLVSEINRYPTTTGDLALKLLVEQRTGNPVSGVGVRIWNRLRPGNYQITTGVDTDRDDQIDTPLNSIAVDLRGRVTDYVLPPIQSDEAIVVDIRLNVLLSPDSTLVVDLAMGSKDITVDGAGNVTVTLHNIGSKDLVVQGMTTKPQVALYVDGVFHSRQTVDADLYYPATLDPTPSGPTPSQRSFLFANAAPSGFTKLEAVLGPGSLTDQITTLNDRAVLTN